MKLDQIEFSQLLPYFMRADVAVAAFCEALDELLTPPGQRIKTLRIWDQIDKLNEAECDELAWELGIDWYESKNMTLEEKRATIKTAQQIKRKRGTKQAVEQILRATYGNGKVSEWFEYGGEPFNFKVQTDAVLNEDNTARFLRLIAKAKNIRSHLQGVSVARTLFLEEQISVSCVATQYITIQCEPLNHAANECTEAVHMDTAKAILP